MGPENGARKKAKNMHKHGTHVLSYTCMGHKCGSKTSSSQGENGRLIDPHFWFINLSLQGQYLIGSSFASTARSFFELELPCKIYTNP